MHLLSKVWIFFFLLFFLQIYSKQGPCFTAAEGGGDRRLVEFELACKADGVEPPDLVKSGHC